MFVAVEDQAIDRIHRIGQLSPSVHVTRLTIPNTVEDRILIFQDKKRKVAEGAYGERSIRLQRLTLEDLVYLFGSNYARVRGDGLEAQNSVQWDA